MRPIISIIVPCFNVEHYLDRCMESLVGQTLQEIEIIMVDDKSPDRVPQMCNDWARKDERIKVIHKTVNDGLGYARNTGLEIATGEYIAFVDSDDFVDLRMYETLFEKALSNNADAVYCNCCNYYYPNKKVPRFDVKSEKIFNGRNEVDDFLLDMVGPEPNYPHDVKYMMSVWHAIYKRDLFITHDIKFVSERELISEDLIFHIDYLSHCEKIIYIPDCFYFYCFNGDSLSRSNNESKYDRIKYFEIEVGKKLNTIFIYKKYILHFQRLKILHLRTQIQAVSNSTKKIKRILDDPHWEDVLHHYPLRRMETKHLIFLVLSRFKMTWLLSICLNKIMYGKNN